MTINRIMGIMLCLCAFTLGKGQPLTLGEVRAAFTKNNLWLLAQKEQISIQEALVLQSRLWESPVASAQQILYNPGANAWLGTRSVEQYTVSVEQLLYIGRQRNKSIELAKEGSKGATYQFYLLLKELDTELSQTFVDLYYTERKIELYQSSDSSIRQVIGRMEMNSGAIAASELFRLKSFVAGIQSIVTELTGQKQELKSKLRLLTGLDSIPSPYLDESIIGAIDWTLQNTDNLCSTAEKNRMEMQINQNSIEQAQTSLELEKSRRWGLPTVGATYDHRAGVIPNYWGLTLSVPLTLWNSNKGNIRAANARIKQAELEMSQWQFSLQEEVKTTLSKAQNTQQLYRQYAALFTDETDGLLNRLLGNYTQRNIGLVEFLDHYQSLQETEIQFLDIKCNFLKQSIELNRVVGTPLFSFE